MSDPQVPAEPPKFVAVPFDEWRVWRDERTREQIRKEAAAPFVNALKLIGITSVIPALLLGWSWYQSAIFSQAEQAVRQQLPLAMVQQDNIIRPARDALTAQLTQWVAQEQTRREIFADPELQKQVRAAASNVLSGEITGQANARVVEARRRRFLQEGVPTEVRLGVLADILDADSDGVRLTEGVIQLLDTAARMRADTDGSGPALAFALSAGRTAVSLMLAAGEADGQRFAPQWQLIQASASRICETPGAPLPPGAAPDLARIFGAFEATDRAGQVEKLGRWLRATLAAGGAAYPAVCADALAAAAGQVGGTAALLLVRDLMRQRMPREARAALQILGNWVSVEGDRGEAAAMVPAFDAALTTFGIMLAGQPPPYLAKGEARAARIAWMLSVEAAMADRPRPDMLRYHDAFSPGAAAGMPAAFLRYVDRWRLAECLADDEMPVDCGEPPAAAGFARHFENRAWRVSAHWLRDGPERMLRAARALQEPQRAMLSAQLAGRLEDGLRRWRDSTVPEEEDAAALTHALELWLLAGLDAQLALPVAEQMLRRAPGLSEHPSIQYALRGVVLRNAGAAASRQLAEALLSIEPGRPGLDPLLVWLLARLVATDSGAATQVALAAGERERGPMADRRHSVALLSAWASGPRLPTPPPVTLRPGGRPGPVRAAEAAMRPTLLEEHLLHSAAEEVARSLADARSLAQAARLAAALHPLIRNLQPENPDASPAVSADLWFLLLRSDLSRPIAMARASQTLDAATEAALERLDLAYWRAFARQDAPIQGDLGPAESREGVKAGSVLRLEIPPGLAGRISALGGASQMLAGSPHLVAVEPETRTIQGAPLNASEQGVRGAISIEPARATRTLLLRIVGARESDTFEIRAELAVALEPTIIATRPDPPMLRALPVTPMPAADALLGFTIPAGQAGALVRLNLPAGMLLEAETREPRGRDTIIELLDLDGRRLAYDDDGGSGDLLSRMVYRAAPRAVVLRFALLGGAGAEDATFLVRIAGRTDDARAVTLGASVSAELSAGAVEAVFAAELPAGQGFVARTTNLAANLDTVLTVQNPLGQEVGTDDDGGGGLASCLAFRTETAGLHLFAVRNIRALTETGSFDFLLAADDGRGCAPR